GRTVERLTAENKAVERHRVGLERVIEEANKLPDDVQHDAMRIIGDCCIPNGVTKGILVAIARSALNGVLRKVSERQTVTGRAANQRDQARAALDVESPE